MNEQNADTPRTKDAIHRFWNGGLWSERFADFARTLERELAEEKRIQESTTLDWAKDHTHLQELCLEVGLSEKQVYGDKFGVPCIQDLADQLRARIAELEADKARLAETYKLLTQLIRVRVNEWKEDRKGMAAFSQGRMEEIDAAITTIDAAMPQPEDDK